MVVVPATRKRKQASEHSRNLRARTEATTASSGTLLESEGEQLRATSIQQTEVPAYQIREPTEKLEGPDEEQVKNVLEHYAAYLLHHEVQSAFQLDTFRKLLAAPSNLIQVNRSNRLETFGGVYDTTYPKIRSDLQCFYTYCRK